MWAWALCLAAAVLVRGLRSGRRLVDFLGLCLVSAYARLWHGWRSTGRPPWPLQGPAILVANHPSSADPAFVQAAFPRPIGFVIGCEYDRIAALTLVFDHIHCVPVRRDVAGLRIALRRLSQGHILCIFPEGGLSNAGRSRLRAGKAGVALLALRSRVPVYPVLIQGGPQTWRILRAWLRPSRVRVTFGSEVN
jgi:1-acyl-sn-glycerol-3-phosphate acyltransferase